MTAQEAAAFPEAFFHRMITDREGERATMVIDR